MVLLLSTQGMHRHIWLIHWGGEHGHTVLVQSSLVLHDSAPFTPASFTALDNAETKIPAKCKLNAISFPKSMSLIRCT